MDFNDTPQEAKFRAEARSWLEANVPKPEDLQGLGLIERAKLWQKRKFDAGWAVLTWPKEYGGRGASPIEQVIWNQEEAKFELTSHVFTIGIGMAAPTIMVWGDAATKAKYLPRLASGEDIWCQLFSEPAGGSDLAALRTHAVKDGDEWVVNGQKIWTSGAHFSDFGILVLRTDPTAPKHKGLTYFCVDMKSKGIEIKPIRQISGEANFNEVYFTDVRVPDSQRLGAVGQGWQVALTTLMNERASIGAGAGSRVGFDGLLKLARKVNIDDRPAIENDAVRAKLADWYCQEAGLRYTSYRTLSALSRGQTPGPESAIGKLVGAPMIQDMSSFAIDLLEQSGAIWDPKLSAEASVFQGTYMGIPGLRIAGGTDEIMANIIAERVLGLPQEPRMDKGIPFNQVPSGPSRG